MRDLCSNDYYFSKTCTGHVLYNDSLNQGLLKGDFSKLGGGNL